MTVRITLIAVISALIAACAGRPVPLAVEMPPPNEIQLAEVIRAPAQFQGTTVRWGGSILSTERHNGGVRVEILQRFLEEGGKPDSGGPSDGRFLADISPVEADADYSRGRFITVSGTLAEPVKKEVNEQTEVTLPVVNARQYYTWSTRKPDRDYHHRHYRFPPPFYYYRPYYYPYYHPPYFIRKEPKDEKKD